MGNQRKRDASDRSSDGPDGVITLDRGNVGYVLAWIEVYTTDLCFQHSVVIGFAVLFGTYSKHAATPMAIDTYVESQTWSHGLKR